jgi:hypothetical protein
VAPVRSGNFQIEIENTATPKYWVKIWKVTRCCPLVSQLIYVNHC